MEYYSKNGVVGRENFSSEETEEEISRKFAQLALIHYVADGEETLSKGILELDYTKSFRA